MSENAVELERLRRELLEANQTLQAIRNGEVDAFVVEKRGSMRVETLAGADTPYRVLVESIRDGALTVSDTGAILYCNQQFAEFVAEPDAAIIGRQVGEWLELCGCELSSFLQRAAAGEAAESGLLRCRERTLPVAVTACALRSDEGTLFCLLLADRSDRVEAERLRLERERLARQRAELDAICSRLPFAVLLAETPGSFNYQNPAAILLLRRLPDLERLVSSLIERAMAGAVVEGEEAVLSCPKGSEVTLRQYATPLAIESAVPAALVVFEDVSAERHAERIRERQEQLRELFVGILGHDLRAPLMAIATSAELLERQPARDQVERTARRIQRASARMKQLIDDMLDFTLSRIGGGIPVNPAPADLSEVVKSTLEELQTTPGARFELVCHGDARGEWDAVRLEQALANLLVNAVEHGAQDKPIRIWIDARHERVRLGVENEGPPIPAELLPRIFEPFQRAASQASRGRGLGLGLYISERIVSAHGGTISVRSNEHEGTAFVIELPRAFQRG